LARQSLARRPIALAESSPDLPIVVVAAVVAAQRPIAVAAALRPLAGRRLARLGLARLGLARLPIALEESSPDLPIVVVAAVVAAQRPIAVAVVRHPSAGRRLARLGLARLPIAPEVPSPGLPIVVAAADVAAQRPIAVEVVLHPLAGPHWVLLPIVVGADELERWTPKTTDRYGTTERHNSALRHQAAIRALRHLDNLDPLPERHPVELVPTNYLKFDQKNQAAEELQPSEVLPVHQAFLERRVW